MSIRNPLDVVAGDGLQFSGRTLSVTAAQPNITSLGTLTTLTVDNITIDGNDISTGTGNLTLTPFAGSSVIIDGGASFDGTVLTGLTALTSTAITGTLQTVAQGNITSLGTLTTLTVDNITINANDISTGSGNLTLTPFAGSAVVIDGGASFDGTVLTGLTDLTSTNITGTLQTAVQGNITSLGTLTTLTVDNITINANDISTGSGNLTLTPVGGSAVVIDGGASFDGTVLTGLTALTSTAITGTLQTAAQANITSVGTLTSLTSSGVITANGGFQTDGGAVFSGGEVGFIDTGASLQSGIYSLSVTSPTMFFDHRASSNTGSWSWRNGTGGGSTQMTLGSTGALGGGITTITATGVVTAAGITSTANIQVNDSGGPTFTFSDTVDDSFRLQMNTSGDLLFLADSSSERLRIESAGALVGSSSATFGGVINASLNNTSGETDGSLVQSQNDGTGDAVFSALISGRRWYWGIDNSDNDEFKIATTSGTPSFAADTRFHMDLNGNLLLFGAVRPTGTNGKTLMFADNGGTPLPGTNNAGLYGQDVSGTVEMFGVDEAQNATQLTSHNPLTGEWRFYSKNTKTGREVEVDLEKFFKKYDLDNGTSYFKENMPLNYTVT